MAAYLQKWSHLSLLPCVFVLCKVTWQLILLRGRIYSYLTNLDWLWLMLADRIWQTMFFQLQAWTPLPCEQACASLLDSENLMAQSLQSTANKAAGEWGHVRPASFSQPEIHLLMWSRCYAAHTFFPSFQRLYVVGVFHYPNLQMIKLRQREVNGMPIITLQKLEDLGFKSRSVNSKASDCHLIFISPHLQFQVCITFSCL